MHVVMYSCEQFLGVNYDHYVSCLVWIFMFYIHYQCIGLTGKIHIQNDQLCPVGKHSAIREPLKAGIPLISSFIDERTE